MNFHLTDAGRAAITDAANRRTNQVVFTRMVVGDGLAQPGVDDSGRVALRNERQRQGLTAVAGGVARIGVRASFTGMPGNQVWNATEMGLIAQVGAGPGFLAAYGAVEAGADAYAVVAPGVAAVIAATVDVVVSAAAVAVTVTPDVTVAGASTFEALLDTPGALTPLAYYRGAPDGLALEARTAADVLADLAGLIPRWETTLDQAVSNGATITTLDVPAGWTLYCGLRFEHGSPGSGFELSTRFVVGGHVEDEIVWRNEDQRTFIYTWQAFTFAAAAAVSLVVTDNIPTAVRLRRGAFLHALPPAA